MMRLNDVKARTVTDIGPIIVIGVGAYLAISGSITVGTLAAFVGSIIGPISVTVLIAAKE
jgi:ABC-type bacteriocin/lantibiotic exporter with double-glycine peptidase domain